MTETAAVIERIVQDEYGRILTAVISPHRGHCHG